MQGNSVSDKTLQLKNIILKKYPSVREFARQVDIPHGTIASALNNGIEGMAWERVVRICDSLQIDYVTFEPRFPSELSDRDKRMLAYFSQLDEMRKASWVNKLIN